MGLEVLLSIILLVLASHWDSSNAQTNTTVRVQLVLVTGTSTDQVGSFNHLAEIGAQQACQPQVR